MESVISLKNCKADWEPNGKVLVKTMLGFTTGKEKEDLFLTGYEKVKKENGKKWLSDNRKLKPWSQDDIKWINEVWFVKMMSAGWKYWAIVEPESIVGNMSMKNFIEFYKEKGLEVKIFNTLETALEWLRSVN